MTWHYGNVSSSQLFVGPGFSQPPIENQYETLAEIFGAPWWLGLFHARTVSGVAGDCTHSVIFSGQHSLEGKNVRNQMGWQVSSQRETSMDLSLLPSKLREGSVKATTRLFGRSLKLQSLDLDRHSCWSGAQPALLGSSSPRDER